MVVVHVPVHEVPADDVPLDGAEAPLGDDRPAMWLAELEGVRYAQYVDPAVVGAGKVGVAREVVEAVGVELARDQAPHRAVRPAAVAAGPGPPEHGEHVARADAVRVENVADLGLGHDPARHLLVVEPRRPHHRLERVRERAVPNVVEERRRRAELPHVLDLVAHVRAAGPPHDRVVQRKERPHRADAVREPRVRRARVHEVREAELAYPPEPLELLGLDKLADDGVLAYVDEPVDGVHDEL